MDISKKLTALRTRNGCSQEKLAEKLNVSRQAIQKWENGSALPNLDHLTRIAKLFGVTLDSFVLDSDLRSLEELAHEKGGKSAPEYDKLHAWEVYSANLDVEWRQSLDEGLDIEKYRDLFEAVRKLPLTPEKERLADVLYDLIQKAPMRPDYPYREPSDLQGILAERDPSLQQPPAAIPQDYRNHVAGAWYGRIIGCLLGKPVEGIRTEEFLPLLKRSGNFPMHRYILSTDIDAESKKCTQFRFTEWKPWADIVDGMPSDDDTNYTVLYQETVERCGRDFSATDIVGMWLDEQPKSAYCTAERVAYCNFVRGYFPPLSATYKNPFREWIGAQIRGDYFGYINPGDPEAAATMALRDACLAQTKNGIYGELFVAAALATAAVTDDIGEIVRGGLSQIPAKSRLYERLTDVLNRFEAGESEASFFSDLHQRYNEHEGHDWCHTISNAEIVVACLLWGKGDFGRSICMAVEQGFDTDCNGATVGSILGMRGGVGTIGKEWFVPLNGKLHTSLIRCGTVKIEDRIDMTMRHLPKKA
ncbi:MAG: ADP-ribosylglycohydrolase family protein [Clostridia bacterium]|nr:ADP-ribosylglycohydrolase family protein [Clostridia bacterium]